MAGPSARFALGLGSLALVVAIPTIAIARLHGFDGLYGQDAFAYADYALGPLRAALLSGHALPDFPLPPGYPLLVAIVSIVIGPAGGIAQAVSIASGAAVPVLVALLAREVLPNQGPRIALLAGLLAAVTGQLWQSSLVAMPDTTAVAAGTLGAVAACRFDRTGSHRWLVVAGASLALAVETRLIFGVAAAVFGWLAVRRLTSDARVAWRRAAGGAVLATAAVVVVLAPAGLAIAAAVAAGRPIPFGVELGVARFDLLTPLHTAFVTADGHLVYDWPMLAWYALQPIHWYWLGILGLAVLLGIGAIVRPWNRGAAASAALVAWPGLAFLVLVFYPYQNPRFFLALLPPTAILAGVGIGAAGAVIRTRTPRATALGLGVLVLGICVNAGLSWRYADGFVTRQAADVAAIRRLEAAIPGGGRIVSLGATPLLRHDGRTVVELFELPAAEARALAGSAATLFVLVDERSIQAQWVGTSTGRAFDILAGAPGFGQSATAGAWTLFRTGP